MELACTYGATEQVRIELTFYLIGWYKVSPLDCSLKVILQAFHLLAGLVVISSNSQDVLHQFLIIPSDFTNNLTDLFPLTIDMQS